MMDRDMTTPMRRPLRAPEDFWLVMERCLVEFHGWDAARAHARVSEYRALLAAVLRDDEDDLILHAEPFEIAGDMAGRYLDPFEPEHRRRYHAIIQETREALAREQGTETSPAGARSRS
jgi:hypothetical protein